MGSLKDRKRIEKGCQKEDLPIFSYPIAYCYPFAIMFKFSALLINYCHYLHCYFSTVIKLIIIIIIYQLLIYISM